MANENKVPTLPPRGSGTAPARANDRARDVESLACAIFAQMAASSAQRGKTHEAVAQDAIVAAKAFYRVIDQTEPVQPQG